MAARLDPVAFADLAGWDQDDHLAALRCLAGHAAQSERPVPPTGALGISGIALAAAARAAADHLGAASPETARRFFERRFRPHVVDDDEPGFLTAYFEPDVAGALAAEGPFGAPLRAPPVDLVALDLDAPASDMPPGLAGFSHALRRPDGTLAPCPDRPAIEDGALDAEAPPVVYVADPIDAFFIHVQGSARIRLGNGDVLRLAYAGKSGHPYTSIGKRLVARGVAPAEKMTADALRAWLVAHPVEGRALMRENRSYVFFRPQTDIDPTRGAVAAAGVPLTPGRSLAIDRRLHTYGTPVWIEADLPLGPDGRLIEHRRLYLAEDTGSAIVGPARGDLFIGLGDAAGVIAGRVRHVPQRFVVLVPTEA